MKILKASLLFFAAALPSAAFALFNNGSTPALAGAFNAFVVTFTLLIAFADYSRATKSSHAASRLRSPLAHHFAPFPEKKTSLRLAA